MFSDDNQGIWSDNPDVFERFIMRMSKIAVILTFVVMGVVTLGVIVASVIVVWAIASSI